MIGLVQNLGCSKYTATRLSPLLSFPLAGMTQKQRAFHTPFGVQVAESTFEWCSKRRAAAKPGNFYVCERAFHDLSPLRQTRAFAAEGFTPFFGRVLY